MFDFFSGCGGTSCGLETVGFEIAYALDNDAEAIESFKENFSSAHTEIANLQDINPKRLFYFVDVRRVSHSPNKISIKQTMILGEICYMSFLTLLNIGCPRGGKPLFLAGRTMVKLP